MVMRNEPQHQQERDFGVVVVVVAVIVILVVVIAVIVNALRGNPKNNHLET